MSDNEKKRVHIYNWGLFFLQRVHQFFLESELCDLTLQFASNERIKVHRLVVNAFTDYFRLLEKQGHSKGDTLQIPPDLQFDGVTPVINFMYTGKLEYHAELHKQVYLALQKLEMTLLTKVLDDADTGSFKQVAKRQTHLPPVTYNLQGKKIAPKQIDPDLPETLPGRKLPIWKRRNVPSNPYYDDTSSYGVFESPGRLSLPSPQFDESPRPTRFEWPEEQPDTHHYTSSFDDLSYETRPIVKPTTYTDNKHSIPKPENSQRVATFEEICRTATNLKRVNTSPSGQNDTSNKKAKLDLQAVKEYVQEHRLRKVLLDTAEENSEEVDDDLAVADLDDDDDMDDEDGEISYQEMSEHEETQEQQFEPVHEQKTQVQEYVSVATAQELQVPSSQPITSAPVPQLTVQTTPVSHNVLPPQKSILKAQSPQEETIPTVPVSVGSKKVRFLLDTKSLEGKENAATTPSPPKIRHVDEVQGALPTRAENVSAIVGGHSNKGVIVPNHTKIISEVLKKYPHLVKNNKNIKLKIMQRGGGHVSMGPMDGDSGKMVKSKVSYVVLKSDVTGKGKQAVILKQGGQLEPLSELVDQKPASGAENTTGPWLCHSCGSNEEPIHFETYYSYRRHLQDIHMEKIDARICEHCGHRASKRNLLLYHLYTKHGVPPPRNCQFPKCDQCDYVALSESLLIKHRNNHSNNKEFVCKVCNAAFKSNGALQGHMQTNLHSDPSKKLYECPFCQKPFVRNINLKAHIRTSHKEVIKKIDEEGNSKEFGNFEDGEEAHSSDAIGEESLNAEGEEEEGELMDVPVIDAVVQKPGTGTVMLPSGVTVLAEAPAMQSLVPSSEAEALSNVASGIAASLGLADTLTGEQTVIVLDESQEFVLHSTEIVGEEIASTDDKSEEVSLVPGALQEYIVPEIMPEDSQEQQSGSLSDLDHYPGGGHSTITVTPSQTATAPPPVSVAVSVVGGDEVTMVLTDHDYAPIRDSNGEGVMFFITRPDGNTNVNTSAPEPQLPVLIKEIPQPAGTSESLHDEPPVLHREDESPAIVEQNDASPEQIVPEEIPQQEIQMEEVNELQQTEEEEEEEEEDRKDVKFLSQEINKLKEPGSSGISTLKEVSVKKDGVNEGTLSTPEKKSVSHSTPVRRQAPVQMAEIMKEWDDFEEENSTDLHPTKEAVKDISEDEPRFFRGPVCEKSE